MGCLYVNSPHQWFLPNEASRLFNKMIDNNLIPNETASNVMVEGCFLVGNIKKAFQLYDQMMDRGLKPGNYTFWGCQNIQSLLPGAQSHSYVVLPGN